MQLQICDDLCIMCALFALNSILIFILFCNIVSQAQIDEAKQFYKDQINRLNAIQAVKKKDSYQRYRSAVPKPSRESSVIWFPKKGEQINCPQTPKLTSTTFDGEIREWSNAIESLPQSLTIQKRQIVTKEQQEDLFRRIVNDVYAK